MTRAIAVLMPLRLCLRLASPSARARAEMRCGSVIKQKRSSRSSHHSPSCGNLFVSLEIAARGSCAHDKSKIATLYWGSADASGEGVWASAEAARAA